MTRLRGGVGLRFDGGTEHFEGIVQGTGLCHLVADPLKVGGRGQQAGMRWEFGVGKRRGCASQGGHDQQRKKNKMREAHERRWGEFREHNAVKCPISGAEIFRAQAVVNIFRVGQTPT